MFTVIYNAVKSAAGKQRRHKQFVISYHQRKNNLPVKKFGMIIFLKSIRLLLNQKFYS